MPLRTAPLPRMAGDLTFMRAHRATIDALGPDKLAVLGAPIEHNTGTQCGCRFAPMAIRETSVYFGWHANPQFSHPVDIDAREQIDTGSIHSRLVDLGDIPLEGVSSAEAFAAINATLRRVRQRGAGVILLGGDDSVVVPALSGASAGPCALIQIGGRLPGTMSATRPVGPAARTPIEQLLLSGSTPARCAVVLAAAQNPGLEFLHEFTAKGGRVLTPDAVSRLRATAITELAMSLLVHAPVLQVHLDLSALRPSLHGMSQNPSFGSLSLPTLQTVLQAIGRAPVSTLVVTGLNPTLSGLSVVKTGQRLLVTALLGYIYGRLGAQTQHETNAP